MQNTVKELKYVSDLQCKREYIEGSCFILLVEQSLGVQYVYCLYSK